MRFTLLLLTTAFLLTGCENKDAKYKATVQQLYDALDKVGGDIKAGKPSADFAPDFEKAKALYESARKTLSAEDAQRPAFVNLEAAVEGYALFASVSSSHEMAQRVADGVSQDLKKAHTAIEAGN